MMGPAFLTWVPGVAGLRRKDFAEKVKLELRITEIERGRRIS